MSLFNVFLGVVAPHDCIDCGKEGAMLCPNCATLLPVAPRYGHPTVHLKKVVAATSYQGAAKNLVWQLKYNGAQAAAKIMAKQIMVTLPELNKNCLIVPAPTATGRVRQRGYDQAILLARELSRLSGIPYKKCLRRLSQAHQVGASRTQRLAQLNQAFRVKLPKSARNKHLILIDDVVTTGATLETAAAALKQAGAQKISALVFAQA